MGWNIDGEGDALFATDAVAVGGGDVPHAPRNAFLDLFHFAVGQSVVDDLGAFGDAAKLGKGECLLHIQYSQCFFLMIRTRT